MNGTERVEVWQEPGQTWRWRYVLDGDGEPFELVSNESESSRDEAVSAAQVAYPDLPVEFRAPENPDGTGPARPQRRAAPAVLVVVLTTTAGAALAVRLRRWKTAAAVTLTGTVLVRRVLRHRR